MVDIRKAAKESLDEMRFWGPKRKVKRSEQEVDLNLREAFPYFWRYFGWLNSKIGREVQAGPGAQIRQ
jgi:hypothetical protein